MWTARASLGVFLLTVVAAPLAAQSSVPEPSSTCVQNCGDSGGGGGGRIRIVPVPSGPSPAELAAKAKAERELAEARALNDRAASAYAAGDFTVALALLEKASALAPNDATIADNLGKARAALAAARARDAAAVARVQQLVGDLARSLGSDVPTTGLSFSQAESAAVAGGLAFTPPPNSGTALAGAPPPVDARGVTSGLPRATDDAIAGAFADAAPGVADRMRKGFQAVMTRDWSVATAWFEDAKLRDPANPRIQALIDAVRARPTPKAGATAKKAPVRRPSVPRDPATEKLRAEITQLMVKMGDYDELVRVLLEDDFSYLFAPQWPAR